MDCIENLGNMMNWMILKFFKEISRTEKCPNFQLIYFQSFSGKSSKKINIKQLTYSEFDFIELWSLYTFLIVLKIWWVPIYSSMVFYKFCTVYSVKRRTGNNYIRYIHLYHVISMDNFIQILYYVFNTDHF